MLNLLQDPWIPVFRRYGPPRKIAPAQLTMDLDTDPVVGLAAARPDFKGALFQFLVALLQSTRQPATEQTWCKDLRQPPSPGALAKAWAPLTPYFQLGGAGARFMQDRDPLVEGTEVEIAGLIIDAPGEQTKKLNIDHFIKRDIIRGLCPACTAQALLTLQLNAPAGGAGHRTSLRGGGPLSTFVLADPRTSLLPHADALWTQVWLNVLATNEWPIQAGEAPPSHWLPWALPTATSEQNETVTPMDAHALTVFWATPRRIRLDLENLESGPCDLCGETTDQRIVRYRTRPRGANYVQWEHPHTPHRRSKPTDEWLPVHPQPGGLGYRHWPALVSPGELSKPARVVAMQLKPLGERAKLERQSQLRLWAFGYDLDNAKARSYQEAVMPLLDVDDPKTRKALDERARAMVEAAGGARNMLRGALKDAWFGEKGEARGDFGFVEREFWSTGEEAFFQLLETFAKDLAAGGDAVELMQALALHWQQHLLALAVKLFDHWALYGEPEMGNPRRIMDARARLMGILGSAKFLSQLGGAAGDQPGRPRTVKGAEK